MRRAGHAGMALLAYSPLACLMAALDASRIAIGGAVAAGALAMVPDLDLRVPFLAHHGPTHTVWFAALLGGLAAITGLLADLTRGILTGVGVGVFAALVVALTVLSHIAAAALTPMGVQPWAPWSTRRISYDLVRAANPVANYALLGVGCLTLASADATGDWLAGL